jgi:hypothetical protein
MHLFFCASEVQECVRAIAIMANRFEHDIFSRHHNAHEIAEKSVDLPFRLNLTVHVDISLKKGICQPRSSEASALKSPK